MNEVKRLSLTDHKYGLDIEVPGAAILTGFGFDVKALNADFGRLGRGDWCISGAGVHVYACVASGEKVNFHTCSCSFMSTPEWAPRDFK